MQRQKNSSLQQELHKRKNATKSATTKDGRENKYRTKQASTHLSVACTAASVQYSISPEQLTGDELRS